MMRKPIKFALTGLAVFFACNLFADPPEGTGDWKLVFEETFDKPKEEMFKTWLPANGNEGHILCGRFPENIEVKDGILSLCNRKEKRGTQDWTSGSMNTYKYFKYGYFECRYRYADAPGVNNSFWLMTRGKLPQGGIPFELDINEGHYPDEINCTIHDWRPIKKKDGGTTHKVVVHKSFEMDPVKLSKGEPLVSIPLDVAVSATKIRISSNYYQHFHIREIAAYEKDSLGGYPSLDTKNIKYPDKSGKKNLLEGSTIKVSGHLEGRQDDFPSKDALDGKLSTSWCANGGGEKWIEITLPEARNIGCIQFITGWINDGKFLDCLPTYKVEYFDGKEWKTIKDKSSKHAFGGKKTVNLARSWNTYGFLWTPKEFVFYFNGKEMLRTPNDNLAHYYAPVFLSAAITNWAHGVSDEIDGTSMDVDYVRVWQDYKMGGGILDNRPPEIEKTPDSKPERRGFFSRLLGSSE